MKRSITYLIIIVLLTACASVKKNRKTTSQTVTRDSMIYVEKVRIDTFKVNADSTRIVLTPYFLKDTMWTYIEKTNGRSKVVVQRIRDTVFITGYCDSIVKLILNTEKTAFTSHYGDNKQTDTSTKTVSHKTAVWIVVFLCIGLFLFIVISILLKSFKPF